MSVPQFYNNVLEARTLNLPFKYSVPLHLKGLCLIILKDGCFLLNTKLSEGRIGA